jgi:hypothetical protein
MAKMRPHELTLQVLDRVGASATPTEIDVHVNMRAKDGTLGEYAGKHVWFLRKLGFGIDATKNGRTVELYTLVGEPENAAVIRAGAPAKAPKVVKAKAPKVPKAKVVKAPKVAPVVDTEAVEALAAVNDSLAEIREAVKTGAGAERMAMIRAAAQKVAARKGALVPDPVVNDVPVMDMGQVAVDPDFDYQADYEARGRARMLKQDY